MGVGGNTSSFLSPSASSQVSEGMNEQSSLILPSFLSGDCFFFLCRFGTDGYPPVRELPIPCMFPPFEASEHEIVMYVVNGVSLASIVSPLSPVTDSVNGTHVLSQFLWRMRFGAVI